MVRFLMIWFNLKNNFVDSTEFYLIQLKVLVYWTKLFGQINYIFSEYSAIFQFIKCFDKFETDKNQNQII